MAPTTPAAPTLATLAGDAALDFEELPEVEVDEAAAPPEEPVDVAVEPAPEPVPDPEPPPVLVALPEPPEPADVAVAADPDPAEPLTDFPTQLVSDPALIVNGAVCAVRPLLSRTVKSI